MEPVPVEPAPVVVAPVVALDAGAPLHGISGMWLDEDRRIYVMALGDQAVLTHHENFASGAHCSCGWQGTFEDGRVRADVGQARLTASVEKGALRIQTEKSAQHCCYDENDPEFVPPVSRTADVERLKPTACVTKRVTQIFHDGAERDVPAGSTVHWMPDEETGSYAAAWVDGRALVGSGDRNPCFAH